MKSLKLFKAWFILIFIFSGITGQESVLSSGHNFADDGGTITYSVGQITFNTFSNEEVSLSEGVEQPYEIFELTGINELNKILLSYKLYPNPVTDIIILEFKNWSTKSKYRIIDIQGRVLITNTINNNIMEIPFSDYSNGIYTIDIIDNQKILKTFKIVKNQ